MICYKDFLPQQISGAGFFSREEYESLDAAVDACNLWIRDNDVTVINVETVVLPNVWRPYEEGTADGSLHAGDAGTRWHQFVRCWYHG